MGLEKRAFLRFTEACEKVAAFKKRLAEILMKGCCSKYFLFKCQVL